MARLFLIVLCTFSGIQFNSFKRWVTVPGSHITVFNEACSSSLYSLYLFDIFFKCGSQTELAYSTGGHQGFVGCLFHSLGAYLLASEFLLWVFYFALKTGTAHSIYLHQLAVAFFLYFYHQIYLHAVVITFISRKSLQFIITICYFSLQIREKGIVSGCMLPTVLLMRMN